VFSSSGISGQQRFRGRELLSNPLIYKLRNVELESTKGARAVVAARAVSVGRQILRFFGHSAIVYVTAEFGPFWFAAFLHRSSLRSPGTELRFVLSHLILLSTIPSFVAGMLNARFRHVVAYYVWILPAVVLVSKMVYSFPEIVFEYQIGPALHYYFGTRFVASNIQDTVRGIDQLADTAPLYAAIAYSFAAYLATRLKLFWPEDAHL